MPETLYSLLQDAAALHGGRTAVEFEDSRLTYAELLDASDRLATLLARHGAGPGRRVAFCFRKSIDAVVALFGIIRTGATYVPLDPAWPAERVSMICGDAETALWVGDNPPSGAAGVVQAVVCTTDAENLRGARRELWHRRLAGGDTGGTPVPQVGGGRGPRCESHGDSSVALASARACEPASDAPREPAEGVANLLYTSGSTGRPKGVQITTRSLLHFSRWVVDWFGLTPEDRVANHAPYNFDLSTLDIFAAVRAGAALCPVPEKVKMFPYQMAGFIADRRLSVWYSVPSALIMMQMRGRLADHDLSALRHVIFAGEVMPKPALQALARSLPSATFTNLYGPTETNVCTVHRIDERDLASGEPVPIGRPIADTRVWIVDEQGRPAADGESGELQVAGPTLTSGYLGDARLTAKRLVPAPDGRGLAYRTGDRVRRRADGALLFEGRLDRMIKCRGHRVEPGEIETVLARHPRVQEAAVVPVPDPIFGSTLKAWVVPKRAGELAEPELIAHCRNHLPLYMVPDAWRFLDTLPRTDREKVDLAALAR